MAQERRQLVHLPLDHQHFSLSLLRIVMLSSPSVPPLCEGPLCCILLESEFGPSNKRKPLLEDYKAQVQENGLIVVAS